MLPYILPRGPAIGERKAGRSRARLSDAEDLVSSLAIDASHQPSDGEIQRVADRLAQAGLRSPAKQILDRHTIKLRLQRCVELPHNGSTTARCRRPVRSGALSSRLLSATPITSASLIRRARRPSR
jgi:hypothetical protein